MDCITFVCIDGIRILLYEFYMILVHISPHPPSSRRTWAEYAPDDGSSTDVRQRSILNFHYFPCSALDTPHRSSNARHLFGDVQSTIVVFITHAVFAHTYHDIVHCCFIIAIGIAYFVIIRVFSKAGHYIKFDKVTLLSGCCFYSWVLIELYQLYSEGTLVTMLIIIRTINYYNNSWERV